MTSLKLSQVQLELTLSQLTLFLTEKDDNQPNDERHERQRAIIIAFEAAQFGSLRGNVPSPNQGAQKSLKYFFMPPPILTQSPQSYNKRYMVMVDEYLYPNKNSSNFLLRMSV